MTFTNKPWLFPELLFGKHSNVKKHWRAVLQEAWKLGSWQSAIENCSLLDARFTIGEVVFSSGSSPIDLLLNEPQWWITFTGDMRPTKARDRPSLLKDQALVMEGLGNLWYLIGHLGKHVAVPSLVYMSPEESRTNQATLQRAIAESIAYWLPELCELSERLSTGALIARTLPSTASRPPLWLASAVQTFVMAYGFPKQSMAFLWSEFYPIHLGEPRRFMQAIELVEPDGDRFRPSKRLTSH